LSDIVITAAKRTAVGSFMGAFASTPAHELGRVAIVAALAQAGVSPDEIDEVILGQILTAGRARIPPARQLSTPVSRSNAQPSASTNCAVPVFAPSLLPRRRSRLATRASWSPAARKICRLPPTLNICAQVRRWARSR